MKLKYVVLLVIGLILSSSSLAQTPRLPFKDVGACPFECCLYRQWIAGKDTVLYREMRDNSPVAFKVKRREKVTGVTGVVITTRAGTVRALKDFTFENAKVSVKKGDVFYTLTYRGEGFFVISYKGKRFEDEVYTQTNMKVLSQPESIWWVKIKNRKGQTGWTRLPENFENKDGCG
jgi:hypothetical protein